MIIKVYRNCGSVLGFIFVEVLFWIYGPGNLYETWVHKKKNRFLFMMSCKSWVKNFGSGSAFWLLSKEFLIAISENWRSLVSTNCSFCNYCLMDSITTGLN